MRVAGVRVGGCWCWCWCCWDGGTAGGPGWLCCAGRHVRVRAGGLLGMHAVHTYTPHIRIPGGGRREGRRRPRSRPAAVRPQLPPPPPRSPSAPHPAVATAPAAAAGAVLVLRWPAPFSLYVVQLWSGWGLGWDEMKEGARASAGSDILTIAIWRQAHTHTPDRWAGGFHPVSIAPTRPNDPDGGEATLQWPCVHAQSPIPNELEHMWRHASLGVGRSSRWESLASLE